jgi:hypothetical protein|eukprot:COSAG06_NODE_2142_length_7430_cov_12.932575_5_plen_79_part_00
MDMYLIEKRHVDLIGKRHIGLLLRQHHPGRCYARLAAARQPVINHTGARVVEQEIHEPTQFLDRLLDVHRDVFLQIPT